MMSAESCRSSSTSSLRSEAPKGSIIRPQPVTETSLLDSVAGFINEVQALNKPNHDSKIQITWASFQTADINDPGLFPEVAEVNGNFPPLMLILGYTQGVQVWVIPMTGEAQEVLAWRQGQVKTLKVLSSPENCFGSPDNFGHCRPLVVMVDGSPSFTSASFISLKSGEVVHNIKFNSEVDHIVANRRVVIVAFREKLVAFDACNLEPRFTVTTCYPSPGVHVNPISLGDRWLAYADQQFVAIHRSLGGMIVDGGQSVTAWGINVGSKLAQGVSKLYSNIFSSSKAAMPCHPPLPSSVQGQNQGQQGQKGIVTILDVLQVCSNDGQDEVNLNDKMAGVVAHFVAHNKAVVALQFDSNGTLLLSADNSGNYFNLYKIMAHPSGSSYSTVHHLYSLYRGETPGSVQDIAFSPDSRWVAVSTLRGTSHIFPITPYGGPIGVRTHTSTRVVNRLSRFHRSAGFDEYRTNSASGRTSPNPSLGSSPVISKMYVDPASTGNCPLVIPYPNPYVPPFPAPTLVQPLAQLRQPYIVTLASNAAASTSSSKKATEELVPIRLAVAFASSRASAKQTGNIFHAKPKSKMADCLFVMANHGVLLEYSLEAMPDVGQHKEAKICESSPVKLHVEAFGQWNLSSPKPTNDLQPPLSLGNPLMDTVLFNEERLIGARHPSGGMAEDKWLSQVEIVTHVGPHRRLWMGPQFCFKTFRPVKDGETAIPLDISCRPEQSNPVNMPTSGKSLSQLQSNVLIECGSASSFELSPRFANQGFRDRLSSGQDQHQDVENEISEAMSDTVVQGEESLDGKTFMKTNTVKKSLNKNNPKNGSSEEEFFCLTPEDARSICSNASDRSRNASSSQGQHVHHGHEHHDHKGHESLEHQIPDTKIFSVAVEAKAKEGQGRKKGHDGLIICDVDTDYTGRFAVVSDGKRATNKTDAKNAQKSTRRKKDIKHETAEDITDEVVTDLMEADNDSCEKLLAEALQTTVIADEIAEKPVVNEPPSVFKDEEDDEEFKEMAKEEAEEEFQEMPKNKAVDSDDDDDEEQEPEVFKIKEDVEDHHEDDDDDDDAHVPTEVDLLGDEIIKSIDKAAHFYEGSFGFSSTEDDLEFKPVTSGKKRKNKAQCTGSSGSSFADSESSEIMEKNNEGWSFEADDLDVNKLLFEAKANMEKNEESQEKAALEDVFKFDSELMASSLKFEADLEPSAGSLKENLSKSLNLGSTTAMTSTTTSNSESSVGNSPNPRAASKKKGKSKKKKR